MVPLADMEEYWKGIAPHDLFPSPRDDEAPREAQTKWFLFVVIVRLTEAGYLDAHGPTVVAFRTHVTHALSLKPRRACCLGTGRRCCIAQSSACTARPMVAYQSHIALGKVLRYGKQNAKQGGYTTVKKQNGALPQVLK